MTASETYTAMREDEAAARRRKIKELERSIKDLQDELRKAKNAAPPAHPGQLSIPIEGGRR